MWIHVYTRSFELTIGHPPVRLDEAYEQVCCEEEGE